MNLPISAEIRARLAACDSCSVSNAIDASHVRLANIGFTDARISCRTPSLPPMVGRVVTLKVRSAEPPMKNSFYLEQVDWWDRIGPDPTPRVLFVEDVDHHPGRGSAVGPVHACILKAMGFVGVVTNGAVRGVSKFQEIGLQVFSGSVSVAHAYNHVFDEDLPVEIAGLRLKWDDLIHGDENGIVLLPGDKLEEISRTAEVFQDRERKVCEYCGSAGFSVDGLKQVAGLDASRR
jgi:4-hydroxy-4-methyl-2-oxoglutarate aldolase